MKELCGADVERVAISPALPCGMPDCGKPATLGLVEHDPSTPGLWQVLPLCPACSESVAQRNRHRARAALAHVPPIHQATHASRMPSH